MRGLLIEATSRSAAKESFAAAAAYAAMTIDHGFAAVAKFFRRYRGCDLRSRFSNLRCRNFAI